jgi:hypothetical protein
LFETRGDILSSSKRIKENYMKKSSSFVLMRIEKEYRVGHLCLWRVIFVPKPQLFIPEVKLIVLETERFALKLNLFVPETELFV